MSRFVYNIRYVKNKLKASALVDYIATREGVEKITQETSDRPASEKQQERIADFLQKFPDAQSLIEYEDYTTEPTVRNASALLSAITDNHAEEFFSSDKYLGYISQRPGVEKHGSHGLFSSDENINLESVKKEVSQHKGNIYTTVLSLRREDAARLGYENAAAWKNLIEKNIHKIAESYKIPIDNLKWYAAFHNEGHHPHCHMVMYSDGKQPYLTKKGIENIKSALATDIFQNDLYEIYSEQQRSIETTQSAVKDILSIDKIEEPTLCEVSEKISVLSEKLSGYTGRKVYGYLPKDCKAIINEIIDRIEAEPTVSEAYSKYQALRDKQLLLYHSADTLPPHIPMRDNVKFKSIKNIIVKEAFKLSGLSENRTPSETSGVNSDDTASDEPTKGTIATITLFSSVFKLLNSGAKPTAKKNIPEQISDIKEKIKRGEKISNDTTISY